MTKSSLMNQKRFQAEMDYINEIARPIIQSHINELSKDTKNTLELLGAQLKDETNEQIVLTRKEAQEIMGVVVRGDLKLKHAEKEFHRVTRLVDSLSKDRLWRFATLFRKTKK